MPRHQKRPYYFFGAWKRSEQLRSSLSPREPSGDPVWIRRGESGRVKCCGTQFPFAPSVTTLDRVVELSH